MELFVSPDLVPRTFTVSVALMVAVPPLVSVDPWEQVPGVVAVGVEPSSV